MTTEHDSQRHHSQDRDQRTSLLNAHGEPRGNPRGRPFAPGNPGRPPGARNEATLVAEALLAEETDALVRRTIELAMAGNPTAMKLCVERLMPRRKRRAPFALPPIETSADVIAALKNITALVAAGELDPSEGNTLTAMLGRQYKILRDAEVHARAERMHALLQKIEAESEEPAAAGGPAAESKPARAGDLQAAFDALERGRAGGPDAAMRAAFGILSARESPPGRAAA